MSSSKTSPMRLSAEGAPEGGSSPGEVLTQNIASITTTAIGQPILLPRDKVQVLVSIVEIAAGVTLPVHKHPFPRYGYILAGSLQVTNIETGERNTYRSGEFVVEMVDRWHLGTNPGPDPVRVLVIDQVEEGSANSLIAK